MVCLCCQWWSLTQTALWRISDWTLPSPSSGTTSAPTTSTPWTRRYRDEASHSRRSFCSERLDFTLLLSLQDHSHTPWIIIIAKYLEKWNSEVTHTHTPQEEHINMTNYKHDFHSIMILLYIIIICNIIYLGYCRKVLYK